MRKCKYVVYTDCQYVSSMHNVLLLQKKKTDDNQIKYKRIILLQFVLYNIYRLNRVFF